MIKRGFKLIICVVLVAALFVGFGSSFASADSAILLRAKAAVAAALLAGQLVLNPIDVALSEPVASAVDPEGKIEWVETFPEYLDRSKIHVYPDVVTIDGIPYTDIWLGPDAANALRLQGLDFASAYNILNNQSSPITYAEGAGYFDDIPMYLTTDTPYPLRSQAYLISADSQIGSALYDVVEWPSFVPPRYSLSLTGYGYSNVRLVNAYEDALPFSVQWRAASSPSSFRLYACRNGRTLDYVSIEAPFSFYHPDPFSFDYTSGIIDAPPAPEDGLLMRVPSSVSDSPVYNYDIHDLINIYPSLDDPAGHTINIDPDLNPDFDTDIDLGNNIGDIIRTILTLLDLLDGINIEYSPEPDSPEPGPVDPDPAVPDKPVSDQDGSWLDELLRWIKQAIDTISQSVIDAKDAIVNEIQDLAQTISELPQQILEDIETGPSKVFRKALDILKSLFLPLLLPIKAMMGLWHYVVEWLASVNAPFLWIFGVMSGTAGNMVLPIYATLAGYICISIYKALGR